MTIAMTASGLAEINGSAAVYGSDSIYSGYSECYVRITYTGTVNSDATVVYGDSGNPNEVTLEWRRTNTAYYDTLKDCCHLYTYGIELNKRFSDNAGNYAQVSFTIQNTTDGYWVKAEQAEDSLYYVTDHVSTEAEATSFVPNTETGVVFTFVLAPTLGRYAWNVQNVLTHVVVPAAAILDFFVTGPYGDIPKRGVLFDRAGPHPHQHIRQRLGRAQRRQRLRSFMVGKKTPRAVP